MGGDVRLLWSGVCQKEILYGKRVIRKKPNTRNGDRVTLNAGFWNVAGIKSKCIGEKWQKDFENWTKGKDIVGLVETWLMEEEWEKTKGMLPAEFTWVIKSATKEMVKGRAKGGMLVGVRETVNVMGIDKGTEGIIWVKCNKNGYQLEVGVVYVNGNWQEVRNHIEEKVEEEGTYIVGGDFNARMGEGWGGVNDQGNGIERTSQDKVKNREGKLVEEWAVEEGWEILNGCTEGEKDGKNTYIGYRGDQL